MQLFFIDLYYFNLEESFEVFYEKMLTTLYNFMYKTHNNIFIMSILDNDLDITDIDVIRCLVVDFLKNYLNISYDINLKDGFYIFENEVNIRKINYDNNPNEWYVWRELYTNRFYIAKWVTFSVRLSHYIYAVQTKDGHPINLSNIFTTKN